MLTYKIDSLLKFKKPEELMDLPITVLVNEFDVVDIDAIRKDPIGLKEIRKLAIESTSEMAIMENVPNNVPDVLAGPELDSVAAGSSSPEDDSEVGYVFGPARVLVWMLAPICRWLEKRNLEHLQKA